MADPTNANELRYLPSSTPTKRSGPNVSSGWVVMLLSGLIAAVLFLFATQQSGQRFAVSVVSDRIAPGQVIDVNKLHQAEVFVDASQLDRLVKFADRKQFEGWVATAPLEPGDLLNKSALRQPSASGGKRAMSIPVDQVHAVAGALRVGDRIDVIDASTTPTYVVQNIEVLAVNNSGGSALSGASQFSLTVAVDSDQATKLSGTIKAAKFDVIRSTGASPVTGGSSSTAIPSGGARP